jgi:glycerol-3-phosphate acyltransferase PlsY
MYVISVLLAAMAFWKHRENIKRLLHGEERKTYLTRKNKVDVEHKE